MNAWPAAANLPNFEFLADAADFDLDGRTDLILMSGGTPIRIYRGRATPWDYDPAIAYDAFEEVVNVEDIPRLRDPLKERLLDLARQHAPAAVSF